MGTRPTIGDIVIYRSKIDNGPGNDVLSPAVVLRTRDTTVPEVVDRWGPETRTVASVSDPAVTHTTTPRPAGLMAELPDDTTVDLLVHGLGQDYREYAVPMGRDRGQWSRLAASATYRPPADATGPSESDNLELVLPVAEGAHTDTDTAGLPVDLYAAARVACEAAAMACEDAYNIAWSDHDMLWQDFRQVAQACRSLAAKIDG